MQKARKSEGVCEQNIDDGLLEIGFQDSEEEKKSDGLSEMTAKMKALSVRTPAGIAHYNEEGAASSQGSWIVLSEESAGQYKDAQSNSTPDWVEISDSMSKVQTIQKMSSSSGYSIISEDTNRTETDKIKRDLPASKLRKLNKIETKFKHEIVNFDRTEICTIC